jgi:hypothetical protein
VDDDDKNDEKDNDEDSSSIYSVEPLYTQTSSSKRNCMRSLCQASDIRLTMQVAKVT